MVIPAKNITIKQENLKNQKSMYTETNRKKNIMTVQNKKNLNKNEIWSYILKDNGALTIKVSNFEDLGNGVLKTAEYNYLKKELDIIHHFHSYTTVVTFDTNIERVLKRLKGIC